MKTRTYSQRPLAWFLVAMLLALCLPVMASDWMKAPSKFSMQASKDHLTFKVLLCDLDRINTYAKSDGLIYATNSSGTTMNLIDIWYIEEGSDENPYGKVTARIDMGNSRAWFTNAYLSGEQQLSNARKDFQITKWGSGNHYCTPAIDFYCPASMTGQQWTFYYKYKHTNGSEYTMTLGTATPSSTMNYAHFKTNDYKVERTGPDKIQFTVPKLPNDVSQKLSNFHIHEGSYKVTFSYKKQDNTTVTQTETFSCDNQQQKSYTVTIPESVGNPKQIDMKVEATDRLKDSSGENFWKDTHTYNTSNPFKVVPVPNSLRMGFRQFDKKVDLSWNTYTTNDSISIFSCIPYIYRMETDENGQPIGSGTWSRRGKIGSPGSNQSLSYTDIGVQQESYYKYLVLNVPKDWENNSVNASQLSNPDVVLLNQLGYVESEVLYTKPTMSIYALEQDTTVKDKVKLEWRYSRVPTSSSSVKFLVMRRDSPEMEWSEYGTVTGDAEPSADYKLSFTDSNLPNSKVRYQYMVRLALNEGRTIFQSDPLTAGMLEGSSVKSFTATKGTHEGTVRLTWEAHQAGTDNTTYVISRRYADTEDDFININTTSGTATLYTYEDNTVQPGYYYEYKIDVYSENLIQNALHDIGFCQARGVVTGRITYGGGASVDRVRLTLRGSGDGENLVSGLSKRIDGASTGIVWKADEKEIDKVFGPDRNFTVQMFVRPDDDLGENAVLGQIPGMGHIMLGSKTDDGYELFFKKTSVTEFSRTINLSTLSGDHTATDGEVLTGILGGNYKISIADGATVVLRDAVINGTNSSEYNWAGITCLGDATIVLYGANSVRGFYHNCAGITIAADNTLTIQGPGSLDASSNGSGAGIGTGNSETCGNIVIESGTINAIGGTYAAGIGAAAFGKIGDITIKGGTITAIGGRLAAGIGASVAGSSCNSITITNDVTKLVAQKDNAAQCSIGYGEGSRCGTVTIGGTVLFNSSGFQSYGESTVSGLRQSTFTIDGTGLGDQGPFYVPTDTVVNSEDVATGQRIPAGIYSLLTVSKNGNQTISQTNDGEQVKMSDVISNVNAPFAIGGASDITEENAFHGNITEVRVFDHALTDAEQRDYADRVLNGREKGLKIYWPMDEGLGRNVFDASYSNDMPNGRHAIVGNNISVSNIIPIDAQLSRYAVTDANGEYIIRGIPFKGSGSTYTLTPTRGIHNFSPTSRNGFIGSGNLTLNNYDFTDVSSFPVKGKITYLNTNIPADSIQFKIDGTLVQTKDGLVMTDANGEYELSVPIGPHLIEAYKDGHRLSSFPLDGSTYDFKQSETINFFDSTLVNVTGRINGGFTDQNAPIGFKASENRIGKATIKLSLGRDSQCSFNYILDKNGSGSFGTEPIPVESATETIRSTAYRAGGDHDDTYYIYITTDPETGEFSALLPPLKYKVESIRFVGGTDYDNLPVFAQNLPVLDATNAVIDKQPCDSLRSGDEVQKYKYAAKMLLQHRSEPIITVQQQGMKNGAFGEVKVPVTTLKSTTDTLQVLTYTDKGYNYTYGHPIFRQGERYGFDIQVAEEYKNLDTDKTFTEIPRDAVISIQNDASILTQVFAEKVILNGEEVEAGADYETPNINIVPDSTGAMYYEFEGGWPYLGEGHIRNMNIGVKVNGRTTMWQAPNSETEALDLILLGAMPTGTNFMTAGPDKVDYILRRPPGSTSVATLETTKMNNYSKSTLFVGDTIKGGGGYVSLAPTWELGEIQGNAFFGIMTKSHTQVVVNTTDTYRQGHKDSDCITDDNSYTLTEKVSTPSQIVYSATSNEFHPENSDTYIGRSTNLTFSKARLLGFYQQGDGSYLLAEKDGIAVSESFETQFSFTQAYIMDVLIPNWKALIKDRLQHVDGNHWEEANSPKIDGKVTYYTSYNEGDPEWGHANGDIAFWGSKYSDRNGWPGYIMRDGTGKGAVDEVEYAINQIRSWEAKIAQNESDKSFAFENNENLIANYSISGGTSVSRTNKTERKDSHQIKDEIYWNVNSENHLGFLFNNAGAYGIGLNTERRSSTIQKDSTWTSSESVSWTLSDGDPRTALSVDVYNSPNQWGPIFRTRGGQTVHPYEPETHTLYYAPGTKLNEGTMRVELPELKVLGAAEQTDVPVGGEARFTLQLHNGSETNSICTYILEVKDRSNPDGAVLMIDGMPLSNGESGRVIKMKGDETMNMQLVVTQSDRSIVEYNDIQLVLKSEKDVSVESEPVKLRVHFVPASAHVDLAVDHTVLNKAYMSENDGIIATLHNLDRQDKGLQGLRLRYRRKGSDTWGLVKQWSMKSEDWQMGYEKMPDGSSFTQAVSFLEDGTYELQAQTFGKYGNDDVTYETDIIEVTQDTRGPRILGTPSPENGRLTFTYRNDLHLRFNEDLNGNSLSKSDNFVIYGDMNNVALNSQYPDVALLLNEDEVETKDIYELARTDFAFGLWFYRKSDGNILSIGTEDNMLALFTHDGGHLSARVGDADHTYDTETVIPAEKWTYLALSYWMKDEKSPQNRISMLYVNSDTNDTPVYVGREAPASDFSVAGHISIGGNGMVGMVHDLTIWNEKKSVEELYETRDQLKAAYTPGLVGYWRMNEGHGTTLVDKARSRNIVMPSESWYINNRNLAAHLDGTNSLEVNISSFNPRKTDNFALEMWFRAEKTETNRHATLLSVPHQIEIGFRDGLLALDLTDIVPNGLSTESGKRIIVSDADYIDNSWHHLTLNVRRGTSAIFYIDGKAVKTLPESSIPGISGSSLYVGGNSSSIQPKLVGDVDELRLWNAALSSNVIDNRRYERLDSTYAGLVGYFPMETIERTVTGNVTTEFSTADMGRKNPSMTLKGNTSQAPTAPALLPGSQYMRMDDSQFNFTASKNEIYFSFPDDVLPLMDGNDFTVSVENIKDEHGNTSEPVEWMFHADFACVEWDSWHTYDIRKHWSESWEVIVQLFNNTGQPQTYEISGQPSWMEVSEPIGTLDEMKEISLLIQPTVPVGKYTEYLYVTDRYGMQRVIKLTFVVEGDVPDWEVNTGLYESNMTITGQIYVGDKISEFTDSKIAAFDVHGNCRGVASPKHVHSRDATYVDMIIYGGSATEIAASQRDLTFRLYDASTGTVYPVVMVTVPDSLPAKSFTYTPDATIGSYNTPVVFRSTSDLMQSVDLARGWTWTSLYLQPASTAINDVLPKSSAAIKNFKNIKGKTAFAVANGNNTGFTGELENLVPGQMYKIQVSASIPFEVYGTHVDVTATPQTIYPNYNWIGSLSNIVMSVADAFAELAPEKDDMVKTRTAMATYNGQGVWEGTLQSIVPGEGYIYFSNAKTSKTFHYPRKYTSNGTKSKVPRRASELAHFHPVDDHLYPDNMNIIAVVTENGERIHDVEVAAFIGGECRGAVTCRGDYFFLTIMGDSNGDVNTPVELRVFDGTEEYMAGSLSFVSDAFYGTLDEPYEINLNATGVKGFFSNQENVEWYNLNGIKLAAKPTRPGVYFANGRKVIVKGYQQDTNQLNK